MAETVAFAALPTDKAARYRELLPQLASLVDGEPDLIANLANVTAALRECLPIASWIGFYIRRSETELVLGPFQGKVACVRIAIGRGVCGTAAAEARTVVVSNVDEVRAAWPTASASTAGFLPSHRVSPIHQGIRPAIRAIAFATCAVI